MSRDIIIHYDEDNGKIVCSTVKHSLTQSLLAESLPLETAVASLRAKSADEAERTFGAGILALLDLSSNVKIGIRDYSADMDNDEWDVEYTEELEQKSSNGDINAQFELAMQLIAEGLSEKSKEKMNKADVLLRQAANLGHIEGGEYLATLWPALMKRADSSFN